MLLFYNSACILVVKLWNSNVYKIMHLFLMLRSLCIKNDYLINNDGMFQVYIIIINIFF